MFRTLEKLLLGISGALGTKASHFLSKNVFWENAVGISEMVNVRASTVSARAFKPCNCVQHPWKVTSRDYLSSRNNSKPLSKLKHIWGKCSWVSQKQWMLELSNLCHCVQHSWKVPSRDFWSCRNERKPLCKQKCVLRKCCGVSRKWWMLELSNLCHCVQHPWKVTSMDFWSSRNERKPLSKLKCVLRKYCGVSQKWWMLELSNLCHS